MRDQVFMELRGKNVCVNAAIIPPDKSAGILGIDFEDEVVMIETGEHMNWELTDDELQAVLKKFEEKSTPLKGE